eukprot:scaffold4841_cov121-Isochrysis_galbana.AAC.9
MTGEACTFCSSSRRVCSPVSATLRSVCLKAHLIDSMMSVKLFDSVSSAGKQWWLMARSRLNKLERCSGKSSKFLVIMSRVDLKTASKTRGTSAVIADCSLLIKQQKRESTSGSRAAGMDLT